MWSRQWRNAIEIMGSVTTWYTTKNTVNASDRFLLNLFKIVDEKINWKI